jgi:saccharopine dehydrogenase-like NADP-dependent oxidoreductase
LRAKRSNLIRNIKIKFFLNIFLTVPSYISIISIRLMHVICCANWKRCRSGQGGFEMNVLCLGGAGKICSEAVLDLVAFSDFKRITIADCNQKAGESLVETINDKRVDFRPVDVRQKQATVSLMNEYDIVMDGTTIHLNDQSTACIAAAGCHGINLNGFGVEYAYDDQFKSTGRVHVPGFGMTPGITDMMVRYAADQLDTVEIVRVSHGAFRPIAFSPSITETTTYEYDPDLAERVVFEDGQFIQVSPFARERLIDLPEPFGRHPQWIIPHAETRTAHAYLKDKGVRLIEVRGTWPPKNMQLVRALYEWGFLRNESIPVGSETVGIMDAISLYLQQAPEGRQTELYGYALHVQVIGQRAERRYEHILTNTHPSSDGSVEDWTGLRAYTRSVGIPLAIGVQLIAAEAVAGSGVIMPEFAFEPQTVIDELARRKILIHETIVDLSADD